MVALIFTIVNFNIISISSEDCIRYQMNSGNVAKTGFLIGTKKRCILYFWISPRFLEVVNEAFDCINAYSVHMAKLATAGEAKAIERQLLFDLKPTGTKWGCSTPPAVPIKIVHSNATWATEQIRNHLHGRQIQFT